ncbi:MAG TPA: response regulator, partial [Bacteroidia bacterium]
ASEAKPVLIKNLPPDYIKVNSSLGNVLPKTLLIYPFQYAGKVSGVIELATLTTFSDKELQLMEMVSENIGIAFNSSQSRAILKSLLEETQVQSEELQAQQEELRQVNEELEEQAQNLKQQQEELQMTNEELEEQTRSLEMKNREVEQARYDIEQKTRQLEITSKYKSEFLANMSHELRTPLNSLLILSKELADNRPGNLSEDQKECAKIIYDSGQDLLSLINEVLDLSKVEAGKMELNIEPVELKTIADNLLREFKRSAEKKELKFSVELTGDIPEIIKTDSMRLNQVLKNLLSNALKFTEKGSIQIAMENYNKDHIVIHVKDTGIGIPEDKQLAVFEAFQQADGGTSRKYGGTGLGLSISRELAKLLRGYITLKSKVDEGSVFSLVLPVEFKEEAVPETTESTSAKKSVHAKDQTSFINYPTIKDNRDTLGKNDKVVLIIEDDLKFAEIMMKQANEKGFKCIAASTGEDGLILARKYKPTAIILDLDLPGVNGNYVLSVLKEDPSLRHIPVHIVSVNERSMKPIKEGAIEYLMKPVTKDELEEAFSRIESFVNRKMKNLLIIEDDDNSGKAMKRLIGNGDVKCFVATTGAEALKLYADLHFDCIVLDIGLPDMSGFELIHKLEKVKDILPPVIVYTGKELSREENLELEKYSESIIIKGVKSEERLLDETALFLHRAISNLPESKQHIINRLYDKEIVFTGKKILLVDDDMRNVFALSKILKERGMEVLKAENGINALDVLDKESVDLVLMDIMMPEMDGYEAMRRIRAQGKFRKLPVIALTAKAMKDDKQKCIDAGANDYITKPLDVERLLSLMRVWLSK